MATFERTPAFNPDYYPGPQPSAPPMPPPPYSAASGEYTPTGFFGSTTNQNELGREMLDAVIANKTEKVIRAQIPQDSTINRMLSFMGSLFNSPHTMGQLDDKTVSDFYLQAGRFFFAQAINDVDTMAKCDQLRKTDASFNQFVTDLASDQANVDYCLGAAFEMGPTPELYFALGKLNFLKHNYSQAVTDFHQAQDLSEKLEHSSSYRKKCFKALSCACAGASNERLGFHDFGPLRLHRCS